MPPNYVFRQFRKMPFGYEVRVKAYFPKWSFFLPINLVRLKIVFCSRFFPPPVSAG